MVTRASACALSQRTIDEWKDTATTARSIAGCSVLCAGASIIQPATTVSDAYRSTTTDLGDQLRSAMPTNASVRTASTPCRSITATY